MKKLAVSCCNCDETLLIHKELKFITCQGCQKMLEIIRNQNYVYTTLKDNTVWDIYSEIIYLPPEQVVYKSDINAEIKLLDSEWQHTEKVMLINNNNASDKFLIVFGFFWIMIILIGSIIIFFVLPGIIFIILGILNLIEKNKKAEAYKFAKSNYERRRDELMNLLNR